MSRVGLASATLAAMSFFVATCIFFEHGGVLNWISLAVFGLNCVMIVTRVLQVLSQRNDDEIVNPKRRKCYIVLSVLLSIICSLYTAMLTALYAYILIMLTLISSNLSEQVDDWYTSWTNGEAALEAGGEGVPVRTCVGVALFVLSLLAHIVNMIAGCFCYGK